MRAPAVLAVAVALAVAASLPLVARAASPGGGVSPGHHHLPPFLPPWDPWRHHGARSIDAFNLMDFIPKPGREFVCGLLSGCPNLAVVESHESDAKKGNLVTVVVSTIGVPTVTVAYFSLATMFDRGNWTETMVADLLRGDFKDALGMQGRSFGSLFAVPGIIEYADVDGDGVYTPDVDTLRKEYRMADAQWEALESSKVPVAGTNDTVLSLKVATADGVVGLAFSVSSAVLARGQAHFTPNGTKIDVTITGFPYSDAGRQHGDSRLAIKAFVAAGSLEDDVVVASNDSLLLGKDGYFTWLDEVEGIAHDGTPFNASVIPKRLPGMDPDDLKNSLANLIVDVNVKDWSAAQTVYFSINATMPKHAYWDPNLGYSPGVDGGANSGGGGGGGGDGGGAGNTPTYIGVGAGAALVVGAAAGLVYVKRKRSNAERAERDPLLGSAAASAADTAATTAETAATAAETA